MGFFKKFEIGIAEAILVLLIILNVLDFLEILPADLDFIKKIISYTALGYLFYKVSITKVLFGTKLKKTDLIIIIGFFLFIVKNFVGFAFVAIEEASPRLLPLYRWLLDNASGFEKITFIAGGVILILVSLFLIRLRIKKPSVMHLIHEDKKAHGFGHVIRFFSIYLVLIAFFVVIFNLAMEWLTIAVDAPLLVFLILFYILFIVKHHKHFSAASLVYKLGNAGENFYENFLELFHEKKYIFMGIAGMLVLHVLTDVANFLVPHVLGFHDILYFGNFVAGHEPVFSLFMKDLVLVSGFGSVSLFLIYLFNIIGMFMLFLGPVYIWTYAFEDRYLKPNKWLLTAFFVFLTSVILLPVFKLSAFTGANLVGVDVLTHQLNFVQNVNIVLGLSLFMGCFFFLLAWKFYPRVRHLGFIIIESFFAYYIFLFFLSIAKFYIAAIPVLFSANAFIGVYLALFFGITVLFYVGGFILFVYEAHIKEKI